MDLRQFYELSIAESAAEATRANLPRARARAIRAQASWQAMLDRIERFDSSNRPDR